MDTWDSNPKLTPYETVLSTNNPPRTTRVGFIEFWCFYSKLLDILTHLVGTVETTVSINGNLLANISISRQTDGNDLTSHRFTITSFFYFLCREPKTKNFENSLFYFAVIFYCKMLLIFSNYLANCTTIKN